MASSSKKRTTMAKINREAAVRDRRIAKKARKEQRRLEASSAPPVSEVLPDEAPAADAETSG